MLAIPAIDLIDGQAVRLRQGDYAQKTIYDPDPAHMAQRFQTHGAPWIHMVDLDGAKAGGPRNLEILRRVRQKTDLRIQWGGGIRTREDFLKALEWGADRVVVGSRLVANLQEAAGWIGEFGEALVAGIDMKSGLVSTHGWGEVSGIRGLDLGHQLAGLGCRRFVVTDIATDGMLEGPNIGMVREWVDQMRVPIIASGGVSCPEDLAELAGTGCEAVIVGKAIYEGRVKLETIWK
ncbi:MAG: 1-(5-phosphoribosyl)-5-[(5-phosphoribosylamino)methylideneamino]imidazole-4-carboxamide isomerase [Armatimonadetes bacterium]|nr:1-(5-phosphoribosyl)-5-[(5-phosphoribosylamino)methylideneamino]imidazole-4-carboxamide isomerase [Armatimonadota bacterium]MBX3109583.1 1-(5-phosphoribosyl)-5-[(5-phosphoribosylamino)methylideneamino]imidazole-4-carboxamide isomerase [Fimbriimonadaceae bacterium]